MAGKTGKCSPCLQYSSTFSICTINYFFVLLLCILYNIALIQFSYTYSGIPAHKSPYSEQICSWIDFPNNFCIGSWTVFQCVNTQTPHKSSQPACTHSLAQLCCGLLATSSVIIKYVLTSLFSIIYSLSLISRPGVFPGVWCGVKSESLLPVLVSHRSGWLKIWFERNKQHIALHQAYVICKEILEHTSLYGRECCATHDSTYSAILPHFTLFPSVWTAQRDHTCHRHTHETWGYQDSLYHKHCTQTRDAKWNEGSKCCSEQHNNPCCTDSNAAVSFQPTHAWCKARLPVFSSLTTISFYSCYQKPFKREKLQCFWGWNGIIVYINFNGGKLFWFVKI